MNRLRFAFQKTLAFLRIRTIVAGLEVSDQLVRLVNFDGKAWQLTAVRLEPGVVENGKIKDRAKFFAALAALKAQSKTGPVKKKVGVVLVFSSVNAYSQVFNLPEVSGDELAKAVELNLQMASPGEAGKMYSDWKIVGNNQDTKQLEILSSFIERDVVDDMVQALFDANFFVMAIEPRSLALSRMLQERGLDADAKKSYILIDVGAVGIDFLVIRNGEPYFEYPTGWTDLADEKGNIPVEKFIAQIVGGLHRVLNFYSGHWPEPIAAIIVSSATLQEEIEKAIAQNFPFPTLRMTLEMGQIISPEWLVAIGAAMRDRRTKFDLSEKELSLLGKPWQDRFHGEQLLRFLDFWRLLLPAAMGLLILIFIATGSFLNTTSASIAQEAAAPGNSSESAQMAALEASSTRFNTLVSDLQTAEQGSGLAQTVLSEIISLAESSQVSISNFSFSGPSSPITLSGVATSEDHIVAFKSTLDLDPNIASVNLPLSGIVQNGTNFTFTVTFTYK